MIENEQIIVRSAVSEDVEAVQSFLEPFVAAEYLLPRTPEEVTALLTNAFCAVHGLRIVGFAAVEIYSRKLAEVQCLAVHSDYQRRGVGKQLVQKCIQLSRDRQILELMVISASEQFLRDCGFDYALPNQKRALFYRPTAE